MKPKKINKDKIITFALIVIGALIIGTILMKAYSDFFKESDNKTVEKLELYGYSLEKNDTEAYKKTFKELRTVLNSEKPNYETYAELLGSLYIIDFYTLTNKLSSTDIGSLEFVYPAALDNFKLKASDTLYKYVEVNFDGKRTQELPEVSEVTLINSEDIVKLVGDNEYEGYKLKYTWTYVKDLGYETEAEIIIIRDETKLYVVESK